MMFRDINQSSTMARSAYPDGNGELTDFSLFATKYDAGKPSIATDGLPSELSYQVRTAIRRAVDELGINVPEAAVVLKYPIHFYYSDASAEFTGVLALPGAVAILALDGFIPKEQLAAPVIGDISRLREVADELRRRGGLEPLPVRETIYTHTVPEGTFVANQRPAAHRATGRKKGTAMEVEGSIDMDDYDIELTPNDPEFGPDECESAYALWAFKEDGEPVKFLEASLVEDPDYPSGYSFSWRSLSCDRTGKLVEGEGGVIGDVSRADYVADMVLPGGAVFSQVEDEYLPNLPYSFEKDSLSDSARKSAAEAIRGAILSLPLSVPETTEAIPAFYRLDNPAMPDDPLTRDMLADALQSVENYHRGGAIDALLCNRDGMSVAKQALIVSAAKGLRSNSGLFDAMSRAVGLIRATEGSAAGVSDCALAQSLLITGFHHMQNRCFDTVSRGLGDVRYMDTSKAVKIFAEELTRDTGLALDAALKGKYAMRYGRDVDALIFTDADIDEYAELLGNCCADLDPEQRSKAAADAVREWCRDHAMDGFSDFLYDYQPEQVKGMARNTGVRH